jgi:hypothetical protein
MRGIVDQNVDRVKSQESQKQMTIDTSLLDALKTWRQLTPFSSDEDWIFASPFQTVAILLPPSITCVQEGRPKREHSCNAAQLPELVRCSRNSDSSAAEANETFRHPPHDDCL